MLISGLTAELSQDDFRYSRTLPFFTEVNYVKTTMYEGFIHAHSGLRWLVLLGLILCIVKGASGMSGNKSWTAKEAQLVRLAVLITHIQVVLGIIMYFMSPKVKFNEITMTDDIVRFYTVEHVITMLAAVVLVTVGSVRSRSREGASAYKTVFWFFLVALVLVLIGIPWPFRGFGAGWF